MMRDGGGPEAEEPRGLTKEARKAGVRHMLVGFLILVLLLFLISWCSLPGR